MTDFTHLHLHTEYSLLDGACRIGEVVSRAKNMGQKSIAITDHGVAQAFPEAMNAAEAINRGENKIKVIYLIDMIPPDRFGQRILVNHSVRAVHKVMQDIVFLTAEFQLLVVYPYLERIGK